MSAASGESKGERDPIQQFFQYFQLEATALQEQMNRLGDVPTIGGERMDAIDHCLAGISRLQKEVQEAASYTTSYDQKMYSEGIKALYEKLEQIRIALAPKSKFSFKSSIKKNSSAVSLTDAAELAMQQRSTLLSPRAKGASSDNSSADQTPSAPSSPRPEQVSASRPADPARRGSLGNFLKAAGIESSENNSQKRPVPAVRKMSFASSKSVNISSHSSVHIILPSSAAHATSSGSVVNLRHCIIDMSTPTAAGAPFAALTIKDVKDSLLICGNVNGAAHITDISNTVLLVSTKQFRMHGCRNCIVYLNVNSRPVIEDCTEIQLNSDSNFNENQWDKIQDFNWPKATPSPNWKPISPEHAVSGSTWTQISQVNPKWSLDDILRYAGVTSLVSNSR